MKKRIKSGIKIVVASVVLIIILYLLFAWIGIYPLPDFLARLIS